MILDSRATKAFWKAFKRLPNEIQPKAKKVFESWREDPWKRNLQFKQIHKTQPIYSVRVGRTWRAVGKMREDGMLWYWIGSHEDYNNLIRRRNGSV